MTLADFLFETKAYQQAKGFIASSANATIAPAVRGRPDASKDTA